MRIAILMTAHENEGQTRRLIQHLARDFAVYVHIDKRSAITLEQAERVFVYKKYNCYWGSFHQIQSTLLLLREAYKNKYDRYLLISGQDLPVKSNKAIQRFFENNHCEYIVSAKLSGNTAPDRRIYDRVTKFWPNRKITDRSGGVLRCVSRIESLFFRVLSKIKQRPIDYAFCKGTNWVNLTHDCVHKILAYLEQDARYLKRYRWTRCADELFYHTIINMLDGIAITTDNLRYVDWSTGSEHPKILREADYGNIITSEKLFARKFDAAVDGAIIEKIYAAIGEGG